MYKKTIGMRLLAFLIDCLMISFLGLILYSLFDIGTLTFTGEGIYLDFNFYETMIISGIYFILFALLTKGKTIGKLITRVEIKQEQLVEISRKQIILREVIKSVLMPISFISFIFVLANQDKKSIHDLIINTIVVRKIRKSDFIEENRVEPERV